MDAIGMIETQGLVASVEAADAMLKAAQVELVTKEHVGGGLVTIIVTGEVGAVKASVDAGSAAAARIGTVISTHVIPRPAGDVATVIERTATTVVMAETSHIAPVQASARVAAPEAVANPVSPARDSVTSQPEPVSSTAGADQAVVASRPSAASLADLSVPELRNLARAEARFPMTKPEIRSAHKTDLIAELTRIYAAESK